MATKPPTWRKIERALIEVLRDYGYTIVDDHGDHYLVIEPSQGIDEIQLEGFARELEDRL